MIDYGPGRRQLNLLIGAIAFLLPWNRDVVAQQWLPTKPVGTIRVATFNVSLYRSRSGELTEDLANGHEQVRMVATAVRLLQPDILLLNELDYLEAENHAQVFAERYLAAPE